MKLARILVALALLTAIACRSEKVSVEELYTTRMLGLGYLQRNQLPEAEAEFKKLTESAPDDPFGYASLGLTYLQAGKYAEAEHLFQRALQIWEHAQGRDHPFTRDVAQNYAMLLRKMGREAEASELEARFPSS